MAVRTNNCIYLAISKLRMSNKQLVQLSVYLIAHDCLKFNNTDSFYVLEISCAFHSVKPQASLEKYISDAITYDVYERNSNISSKLMNNGQQMFQATLLDVNTHVTLFL